MGINREETKRRRLDRTLTQGQAAMRDPGHKPSQLALQEGLQAGPALCAGSLVTQLDVRWQRWLPSLRLTYILPTTPSAQKGSVLASVTRTPRVSGEHENTAVLSSLSTQEKWRG